ncbi:hypothetical protein [Bacillus pumilus]|uniref:hypothetical protein n=1 Tax=Bacillus pumilus TaxID=1408 RepID=UPI003315F15D
MMMKLALFTVVTCSFIGLFLISKPFEADAMRLVSTFTFPVLGLIGFGILLWNPIKKAAK